MDWSSFVARRKLDVAAWCAHNRFKSYGEVKKWCAANHVEAPDRSVVSAHLLKKTKATTMPAPKQPSPVQTKTKSKKKRSTKKDPDSIVGD